MKLLHSLPVALGELAAYLEEESPAYEVPPHSAAWAALAQTAPEATVFHQPEWAEVIRRTYGLRPRYLLLPHVQGPPSGLPLFQAGGLLRRRLISLPFSDVAGPLLSSPQDCEVLMAAVLAVALESRIGRIEIRGWPGPPARFESPSEFCLFVLELDRDLAAIRSNLQRSTVERSLRKAERGPLRVRAGRSEVDMKAFYRLNLLTRRRHGVPPQPYPLFRNMWEVMAPAGLLTLLIAELRGEPVAGMVLLHFNDTAYYKYGASDPVHLHLRPNHLLMWRAIEWARARGCRRLDLGRTHTASEGLMRFKRSWGARQLPLSYWRYPPPDGRSIFSQGSRSYQLVTGCWRHLPLWVTQLGGLFYRHLA